MKSLILKYFFFLIHDSKIKILDTLKSRCVKYNFFLDKKDRIAIINKILNSNFYDGLNSDFKNDYNSPGDIIALCNFLTNNKIDLNIQIENLLDLIVEKKLYKKDLFLKEKLSFLIELYFKKKLNYFNFKIKYYNLYKYFLSKLYDCNKYNLDSESVLIEFKGKVLNE